MPDADCNAHPHEAYHLHQLEEAKPLLDTLSEPIVAQDTEHRILWANRAAARSVDSELDDLRGKPCHRIWARRKTPCPSCPVEAALQSDEPRQDEIATADGQTWLVRAIPLHDENGRVVGAITITLDITHQQRAGENAQNGTPRFRQLFELTPDTVFLLDEDGVFETINHLTVTGHAKEDLIGRHFSEVPFLSEESKEKALQHFKHRRRGDDVPPYVIAVKGKDGDTRYAQIKAVRLPDGKILGFARDITEQKRKEHQARTSAEEMQVISDTAMKLSKCDTIRDVCGLTGDAIMAFNPEAYVIVTAPDEPSGDIRIQYTAGFSPYLERLTRLVGMNPERLSFSVDDMTERERELFTAGRLVDMPGGLHALSTRKIPRPVCTAIERLLDIDAIYAMGFAIDHTPFGGAIILLPAHASLRHREAIEAIIKQTAAVVERTLAQRALQASEAHSRALLDAIPDLMFHFDRDGVIVGYRGARADLYRAPDEFMGRHIRDVVPKELAETTMYHIERALATGEMQRYEYELSVRGEPRRFEARMIPVGDGSVVSVIRDKTRRKEIEEQLRHHSAGIAASMDGIAILDEEERYVYVNDAHARIYGYDDPGELIGESWKKLYDRAEQQRFEEDIMPTLHQLGKWRGEAVGLKKNGDRFPQELSLTMLDDGGLICVVRDITERKRTEQELQRSEKKFRLIAENTSDYISIVNWKGKYQYVSPSHRQLGYEPADLIGKSGLSMIHPDDREKLQPLLRKYVKMKLRDAVGLYRKGVTERVSFRFPDVDGQWHHVDATADLVKSPDGNELQILLVCRDVTEQRKLLEKLRESEERFRAIFEHAMVGIYKTTPDGHILMANPAMLDMLGYDTFDELRERNLEEEGFEPSYDRQRFKQKIESKGRVSGLESSWKKQDGSTLHVRENARAIQNDSGEVQYYLGTVEDITERKQAEEQVARLNDTLRLINKIMRHDILNHLSITESALELFVQENDPSFHETAHSHIRKGMQLIKRMRELESLVGSSGRLQPCNLHEVAEEAIADCPLDCSIKGKGTALADDAIYPAVENLVRNAVQHADASSIHIGISSHDNMVELRVADDGTGIPDNVKEQVFTERYSHGNTGGSGLGLYIVRQTIERYGGSVSVMDNEPQGTVFVIRLPRAEQG